MKLIDKHVLRNFLVPFVFILVSLLGLFLIYDVSSKIARFLKHHKSLLDILNFYLLYVLQLIALGLPMVILLATVLGVGRMSKNNEITAMRACGVSVLRIACPLFGVGLLLSAIGFVMFEKLVTKTYGQTERFQEEIKGREPAQDAIEMDYFLTDDQGSGLLTFNRYLPKKKLFQYPRWTGESENPRGRITIAAWEARWIEDSWWAIGEVRIILPDGTHSPSYSKRKMYEWDFRPEEVTEEKFPEEMTLGELRKNIGKYRASPQKVRTLRIQLHRRMALPLLNLIVVAVALPFALRGGKRGGHPAIGVGVSMFLCLAYYGLSVLISLVSRLPPWIAVWLPNVLFGAGGTIATLRID